jgi:carbamoyl-phosphate synthase large subunit
MKSVGETMAIGRTFKEAFQKAFRSLETGRAGFGGDGKDLDIETLDRDTLEHQLRTPNSQRVFYIKAAMDMGLSVSEIHELTGIDPWFLENLLQIVKLEEDLTSLMS